MTDITQPPHAVTPIAVAPTASTSRKFWNEHQLLEDLNAGEVMADAHTLDQVISEQSMSTADAVIAEHRSVVKVAANISSLSVAMSHAKREKVHRLRNVLAAMLATVAVGHTSKPVPSGLYTPPMRAAGTGRPATADEILLMRTVALAYSRAGGANTTPPSPMC